MPLPASYDGLTDDDLRELLREVGGAPGLQFDWDVPGGLMHVSVITVVATARATWGPAETHDIEALFDPFILGREGHRSMEMGEPTYAIPAYIALFEKPEGGWEDPFVDPKQS